MAIFSNIFSPDYCILILDRLLLLKENALLDIIQQVFKAQRFDIIRQFGLASQETKIKKYMKEHKQPYLSSKSSSNLSQKTQSSNSRHDQREVNGQLQAFLVREIYVQAQEKGVFFPELSYE